MIEMQKGTVFAVGSPPTICAVTAKWKNAMVINDDITISYQRISPYVSVFL